MEEGKHAENADGPREAETREAEYDPFVHRRPGPLNSDFAVLSHLLKSALGTGILVLPHAFRKTGYVMAISCGIAIGLICTHTAIILVRSSQTLCRRNRVPALDFAKTAEISFQAGPERIRKYAEAFGVVTDVIVCFVHFQTAVIYILYVATSFRQVIQYATGMELDVRMYVLTFYPSTCGLSLVPNLKHLAPFSVAGTVFLATGIVVTVRYLLIDFPDPGRLDPFTDVPSVPTYCALFMFALHNFTLYLPLENSMKHPERMPALIAFSTLVNALIYIGFGFLGYNKYTDACDTIIKNLPMDSSLAQVVKIAVALSVLFSFGLAYHVPISIVWPKIRSKFNPDPRFETVFRLAGASVTTLLAVAVPQMVPLMGLLAASCFSTTMLLIPIAIETATKWEERSRFVCAKNFAIFLLYVVILIFGAVDSIRSIVREYGSADEKHC